MSAIFVKSITDLAHVPEGKKPQIALVGRSNVGKSSLVNKLTGQKGLARVSATPGHTQTINFYEVDNRYFLVDLPGYGFARSSKAKQAVFRDIINDYLTNVKHLALVLLIIDARIGPTDSDRLMQAALAEAKIPAVMVLNKMDKLTRTQASTLTHTLKGAYPDLKLIQHSIVTSTGRGEILEEIDRAIRAV